MKRIGPPCGTLLLCYLLLATNYLALDEEFGVECRMECQEVVHVGVKYLAVLAHGASLSQME